MDFIAHLNGIKREYLIVFLVTFALSYLWVSKTDRLFNDGLFNFLISPRGILAQIGALASTIGFEFILHKHKRPTVRHRIPVVDQNYQLIGYAEPVTPPTNEQVAGPKLTEAELKMLRTKTSRTMVEIFEVGVIMEDRIYQVEEDKADPWRLRMVEIGQHTGGLGPTTGICQGPSGNEYEPLSIKNISKAKISRLINQKIARLVTYHIYTQDIADPPRPKGTVIYNGFTQNPRITMM